MVYEPRKTLPVGYDTGLPEERISNIEGLRMLLLNTQTPVNEAYNTIQRRVGEGSIGRQGIGDIGKYKQWKSRSICSPGPQFDEFGS